jgi:hypothetical protein
MNPAPFTEGFGCGEKPERVRKPPDRTIYEEHASATFLARTNLVATQLKERPETER